jgi:hypothetical protein
MELKYPFIKVTELEKILTIDKWYNSHKKKKGLIC